MNTQNECPICMDVIEFNKNCVTTECGHCFHTSCLMTNVAHNGFGCPYCRNAMAEEQDDEEDSDDEEEEFEHEEDEEEDNVLRGFRFFINNINGEENDPEDVQAEIDNEEYIREAANERAAIVKPPVDLITQKLIEQGITMEQIVKSLLKDHDEYEEEEEEFVRIDDEIFGKIRIIISNYQPEQEPVQEPVPEPVPEPVQEHLENQQNLEKVCQEEYGKITSVDFSAQPKTTHQVKVTY